jgi:hypothetical protein
METVKAVARVVPSSARVQPRYTMTRALAAGLCARPYHSRRIPALAESIASNPTLGSVTNEKNVRSGNLDHPDTPRSKACRENPITAAKV